jgi:hypothetical protein
MAVNIRILGAFIPDSRVRLPKSKTPFNYKRIADLPKTGFAHRLVTGGIIRHYGSAIKQHNSIKN